MVVVKGMGKKVKNIAAKVNIYASPLTSTHLAE